MVELKDLPPEVINEVLAHCDIFTLLSLRLVSNHMKTLVNSSNSFANALEHDDYIVWLNTPESLIRFINRAPRFPFSNFEITVEGDDDDVGFYKDSPQMKIFKDSFCPKIQKLSVSRMFCCTRKSELEFFQSLRNIKKLKIHLLEPMSFENTVFDIIPAIIPDNLKNSKMTELIVDKDVGSGDYLINWIRNCPRLEILQIPNSLEGSVPVYFVNPKIHLQQLRQLKLGLVEDTTPKLIDFLRNVMCNKLLRLADVRYKFLDKLLIDLSFPFEAKEHFKRITVSMIGVSESLEEEGYQCLQKLSFCGDQDELSSEFIGSIHLPVLHEIFADIQEVEARNAERMQNFIDRIFLPEVKRSSVSHLYLIIKSVEAVQPPNMGLHFTNRHLDNCPNLTLLDIHMEGFTSEKRFCKLFEVIIQKPHLQQLVLYSSRGFPEKAFVGREKIASKNILSLTNLKILSLSSNPLRLTRQNNLSYKMGDKMLQILSQLALSKLTINGGNWETVSNEGVKYLLEGPLAHSIQTVELSIPGSSKLSPRNNAGEIKTLLQLAQKNKIAKMFPFSR